MQPKKDANAGRRSTKSKKTSKSGKKSVHRLNSEKLIDAPRSPVEKKRRRSTSVPNENQNPNESKLEHSPKPRSRTHSPHRGPRSPQSPSRRARKDPPGWDATQRPSPNKKEINQVAERPSSKKRRGKRDKDIGGKISVSPSTFAESSPRSYKRTSSKKHAELHSPPGSPISRHTKNLQKSPSDSPRSSSGRRRDPTPVTRLLDLEDMNWVSRGRSRSKLRGEETLSGLPRRRTLPDTGRAEYHGHSHRHRNDSVPVKDKQSSKDEPGNKESHTPVSITPNNDIKSSKTQDSSVELPEKTIENSSQAAVKKMKKKRSTSSPAGKKTRSKSKKTKKTKKVREPTTSDPAVETDEEQRTLKTDPPTPTSSQLLEKPDIGKAGLMNFKKSNRPSSQGEEVETLNRNEMKTGKPPSPPIVVRDQDIAPMKTVRSLFRGRRRVLSSVIMRRKDRDKHYHGSDRPAEDATFQTCKDSGVLSTVTDGMLHTERNTAPRRFSVQSLSSMTSLRSLGVRARQTQGFSWTRSLSMKLVAPREVSDAASTFLSQDCHEFLEESEMGPKEEESCVSATFVSNAPKSQPWYVSGQNYEDTKEDSERNQEDPKISQSMQMVFFD